MWQKYNGENHEWDSYIEALSGSFYQSYGWGESRLVAGWQVLRLIYKNEGIVSAAASVLVKYRFGVAVCWVPGGPSGEIIRIDNSFKSALSLHLSSSIIYCRISLLRRQRNGDERDLYRNGWKRPSTKMSSGLTIIYEVERAESQRLICLTSNWRHNLRRSKKFNLQIERWENPDICELRKLYCDMEALKSIPIQNSNSDLEAMFNCLRDRIVVFCCRDEEGQLIAVRAAGLIGDMALDLLAAANSTARRQYASYATLWALLSYCHDIGIKTYDLSGVDPINNKGVFDFKKGTGGSVVECLGEWEYCSLPGLRQLINWQIRMR